MSVSDDDECPICLDPFPADTVQSENLTRSWEHTPCCGKKICKECCGKMRKYNRNETVRRMGVDRVIAKMQQGGQVELDDRYCPLCRYPVPKSEKDEFKLLLKRAKIGKAWAQNLLGCMYMSARGVRKNEAEAARWFKKAAEAGNRDAMACFAECSKFGSGVPVSMIDAKYWYEKALNAGDVSAHHSLGLLLISGGPDVPADLLEAARLFRICADQGHALAQCDLGVCFETGEGVETNIEQAMYWYGKAISQGNVLAMHNYAVLLVQNADEKYGTAAIAGKSPIPQALYWHRKAAAGGTEESATYVAGLEQILSRKCKHCGIEKDSCEKLFKCKKCKAAYYCGRSCQVEHWKMGHHKECGWRKYSSAYALTQSDDEPSNAHVSNTEEDA